MLIPVTILFAMDPVIETLWLADNEGVWEGDKLPCEFNNFPKVVFMTAHQRFFHFLEGSII